MTSHLLVTEISLPVTVPVKQTNRTIDKTEDLLISCSTALIKKVNSKLTSNTVHKNVINTEKTHIRKLGKIHN